MGSISQAVNINTVISVSHSQATRMGGAEAPNTSRDSSPDQQSCLSSHLSTGISSRTSSRASTYITSSTRESTPEFRLEYISLYGEEEHRAGKVPIPADSPL